jgi:hypothetical protein
MTMAPPINDGNPDQPMSYNVRNESRGIARRIVAVLLCLIMIFLLIAGAALHTAYAVVGSPDTAADTFLSVVTSKTVTPAIATAALQDIAKHSTPAAYDAIQANSAQFEAIIVQTIESPAAQTLARADIKAAYQDFKSGSGGQVDTSPLVALFTQRLHTANAAMPASPSALGTNLVVDIQPRTKVNFGKDLNTLAWIFSVIGVVGTLLIARFLVRHKNIQLLVVGLVIGVPGLIIFGLGERASKLNSRANYTTATGRVVVDDIINRIGHTVADEGLVLVAVAAGVILIWLGLRLVRRDSNRSTAAAAPLTGGPTTA